MTKDNALKFIEFSLKNPVAKNLVIEGLNTKYKNNAVKVQGAGIRKNKAVQAGDITISEFNEKYYALKKVNNPTVCVAKDEIRKLVNSIKRKIALSALTLSAIAVAVGAKDQLQIKKIGALVNNNVVSIENTQKNTDIERIENDKYGSLYTVPDDFIGDMSHIDKSKFEIEDSGVKIVFKNNEAYYDINSIDKEILKELGVKDQMDENLLVKLYQDNAGNLFVKNTAFEINSNLIDLHRSEDSYFARVGQKEQLNLIEVSTNPMQFVQAIVSNPNRETLDSIIEQPKTHDDVLIGNNNRVYGNRDDVVEDLNVDSNVAVKENNLVINGVEVNADNIKEYVDYIVQNSVKIETMFLDTSNFKTLNAGSEYYIFSDGFVYEINNSSLTQVLDKNDQPLKALDLKPKTVEQIKEQDLERN